MTNPIEIGIESSPGSKVTVHLPQALTSSGESVTVTNLGSGELTVESINAEEFTFRQTFVGSAPVLCRDAPDGSRAAQCRDVLHGGGLGPTVLCELPMGHELPHRNHVTDELPDFWLFEGPLVTRTLPGHVPPNIVRGEN